MEIRQKNVTLASYLSKSLKVIRTDAERLATYDCYGKSVRPSVTLWYCI